MKSIIKKIIPERIFTLYHLLLALCATVFYGFPSRKLIVIGITGTKGKTSTANFIWSVLQNSGLKTGIISTANIRIGDKEELNSFHMTMPGRFLIQKFLAKMVKEKVDVAIVETTSQGLVQNRHIGVWYDMCVLTNLTPEHIDSHKTFENYKNAKGKMFEYLSNFKNKKIKGKEIPKTIIVNGDDSYKDYFLSFNADKKITYGIKSEVDFKASSIKESEAGAAFDLNGKLFQLSIVGAFNVYNALPALVVADILNLPYEKVSSGLKSLAMIPGRMEEIKEGQDFKVFVDYAHEKQSMTLALNASRGIAGLNKVIVLLGAEGGGRDKAKRPEMGEVVGRSADFVICSNVDPYEDDPFPIANDIAVASEKVGKKRDENLFVILDRREGIRKVLGLAKNGDVVIITGKGAEQSMTIDGKTIPWDDREVVREELKKFKF